MTDEDWVLSSVVSYLSSLLRLYFNPKQMKWMSNESWFLKNEPPGKQISSEKLLSVGINSLYSQLGTIVYWRGHTAYLGTVWLIVRFFTFLHLIKAEDKALGTFQIPSHMRGGKIGSTLTGTSLCWSSSLGSFLTLWGDDTLGWSLSLDWAWGEGSHSEMEVALRYTLLTLFTLLTLLVLLHCITAYT